MMRISNYINGQFVAPINGQYLKNINPANKKMIGEIPDSDHQDIARAMAAAESAFPAWSKTTVSKRSRLLRKIGELILQNSEELALAETRDTGKPISLASTVDIPRSSTNFCFFADAITQFSGASYTTDEQAINYTLRQPLGVVGCISPWNLPLYLFTWKIAPALAAGNTVVAKPSEVTPTTAFLLAKICNQAGLPNGVLNIVHGFGAKVGEPLVKHPRIKAISFTGSTIVGKSIAALAAPDLKKISLEMGGKNPTIIFNDCNFKEAIKTTLLSTFSNQGQICLCGSRIFVEKDIYKKFKTELVSKIEQIKIGNPENIETEYGAMVSQVHFEKVKNYIKQAKVLGGTILTGGTTDQETGYFITPTLIEGLDQNCPLNQEEIFGPVATIQPFETEEEVIQWANSTQYGLAGSIWTENITRAQKMAREIQAGLLWINTWMLRDLRTPFGGVKNSGYGREGGDEALRFFTEIKNICIKG